MYDACRFLFIFFFFSEYKICLPGGGRILAHVFRRPRIFGLWLMFSKDQRFWILAHVFRGLGFWILAHVFRGPKVLDPGSCFQRPRILDLGSCFQRTKGFFFFGFDSRQCVWAFYPSTPCFEECWGWIVDLMLHHWRMWKRIIAFCSWRRIQWRFFFFFFENLNFSKELKFLKFFFLIWKSWIFSRNWKFWLVIFFLFKAT